MKTKRTETVDIIQLIVDSIDCSFVGDEWIDEGDGIFSIGTCDTKWLQPCAKILDIDGTKYTISKIETDSKLYVVADAAPSLTSFNIYKPNFYHGTITQVGLQLSKERSLANKVPIIFLNEGIPERFYQDDNTADRESEIRIFCLSLGRFKDWVSSDDYAEVVMPMRKLSYALMDAIEGSTFTLNADFFDIINRSKMAVTVAPKGSTKKIFADDFSGTDISITIQFSREGCENCIV